MEKRTKILVVALVTLSMCNSVALALPPMGPPRATVGQNHWSFGAEFGYGEMDLETSGRVQEQLLISPPFATASRTKYDIEGLESAMVFFNLGYGVFDTWDIFVRAGAANAKGQLAEDPPSGIGFTYTGMDGSFGFAWGIGTRVTFWQQPDAGVTWGGLFQATGFDPGKSDVSLQGDPVFDGDADLEFWEVQIATGPTLEFGDVRVYGGPFLHFVGGDLDLEGRTTDGSTISTMQTSQDIEEQSVFGGYVGAEWLIGQGTTGNVEFQTTGDAWAVGLGFTVRTR